MDKSSGSRDACMWRKTGSQMAQVMVCLLTNSLLIILSQPESEIGRNPGINQLWHWCLMKYVLLFMIASVKLKKIFWSKVMKPLEWLSHVSIMYHVNIYGVGQRLMEVYALDCHARCLWCAHFVTYSMALRSKLVGFERIPRDIS